SSGISPCLGRGTLGIPGGATGSIRKRNPALPQHQVRRSPARSDTRRVRQIVVLHLLHALRDMLPPCEQPLSYLVIRNIQIDGEVEKPGSVAQGSSSRSR